MKRIDRCLIAGVMALGMILTGCQRLPTTHAEDSPAELIPIEGSELTRVVLTEAAVQRLGLQTNEVGEQRVSRSTKPRKVVPYSSLIYDPYGVTWVYTSPQPRTFVRHKVDVDYIEGEVAVLNDGPPVGTVVASVGVAELYGTETKVGH